MAKTGAARERVDIEALRVADEINGRTLALQAETIRRLRDVIRRGKSCELRQVTPHGGTVAILQEAEDA